MKLNLGCGEYPMPGYTNVDLYVQPRDIHDMDAEFIKGDFREMEFEDVEEVQMQHVLEHLPWGESLPILKQVHGWMREGGLIVVEVPDMVQIMAAGSRLDDWYQFVYGSQQHAGEFHLAGFTAQMLWDVMYRAGFHHIEVKVFATEHPIRKNLPCLEGRGYA